MNQPKRRGKGKNPPMQHVNLRLPKQVVAFYRERNPRYTEAMRAVLVAHYNALTIADNNEVSPPK